MTRVAIYDTTLRDGAQAEGVSFSPAGKIRVARFLDEIGIDYIEGGYAASNPKDMAFFYDIKKVELSHAKIAAFGSTRRANTKVAEDIGVKALMDADTEVVTIFGKSWLLHVNEVLRTTPEENLAMITDTVSYLKEQGKEVIYDAEHFCDGYKDEPDYALSSLAAAAKAGADTIVLCDTNGGTLPGEIKQMMNNVRSVCGDVELGIHAHNDGGLAVANSLESVLQGATHIQGTINGFGERCGNANLCTIVANLLLKMNHECLKPKSLKKISEASSLVYEMANIRPDSRKPFVGASAFAHKAGMHVDGVRKNPHSFEHIVPESVGNQRRILISELSGTSNVFLKAVEMDADLTKSSPEIKDILKQLEQQEKEGYEFEAAEASFKLMIQKVLKQHKSFFELDGFRVIVEKRHENEPCISEATIRLRVNDEIEHTVGEGDGPVDALNHALRRALQRFYPSIGNVTLTDYRVRILDPEESTAAKTRVLIESSDGTQSWGTVGVSENLIEASWEALVDGVEYKLFLDEESNKNGTA